MRFYWLLCDIFSIVFTFAFLNTLFCSTNISSNEVGTVWEDVSSTEVDTFLIKEDEILISESLIFKSLIYKGILLFLTLFAWSIAIKDTCEKSFIVTGQAITAIK